MTRALPRLIVITDWTLPDLEARLGNVAQLGPDIAISHRDPGAATRPFLERARRLRDLCTRTGARLFVNGRVDVALLVDADVHLPEDAAHVADVRRLVGPDPLITVAFHEGTSPERARGADAAIVSPVFSPGSKPDDSRRPIGVDGFERIAASLSVPAYALGGINAENASGLHRVAAISSILRATDPRSAAASILKHLPSPR
ncbi:MAG: thiamine phosphate synthase [Myxococcaceae bacterium]